MTTPEAKKAAATAMSDFLAVSALGGLSDLGMDDAVNLAKAASADPEAMGAASPADVQAAMLGTYFGAVGDAEIMQAARDSEMAVARMKSERWDTLFRVSGVSPEEAGRMMFDRDNGDPSAMLKVKERYYFG